MKAHDYCVILRTILIAGFRLIRLTALLAFLVGVITNWIQMVFTRGWAREKVEPDSAQALAAVFLNLRQFHDVIIFNLVVCAAPLPIYAVDAWIGLRTGLNTRRVAFNWNNRA
jgi:hypothetical protein